jgi:secreted trypsin-like serine protease
MRRLLMLGGAVAAAALLAAAPAKAVVYGAPDGDAHPEVGGLLAQQAYSDGTWIECTGTLISPTVFLTAAHCDEGVPAVSVAFDSSYAAGTSRTYAGTFHADPAYNQAQSDPQDLAVVVLKQPVKGIAPAQLPEAGSLDGLTGSQRFTSVGFGAHEVTSGPGGKSFAYDDMRYAGAGTLNTLTKTWLKLSGNPSTGNAGTCYGDSGGPNFLGAGASETSIIAGTTITGDLPCRSTNVDYRLDTADARAFLGQYVTLP